LCVCSFPILQVRDYLAIYVVFYEFRKELLTDLYNPSPGQGLVGKLKAGSIKERLELFMVAFLSLPPSLSFLPIIRYV
jgi:hypothetical protein